VSLLSNLQLISLVEWMIGGGVFALIVFGMHEFEPFRRWSYAELMALMFLPACVVHAAVIAKFVRLQRR
jgi:hypothetical protein